MNDLNELTMERLREAVSGTAAAFRCRTRLQPAGGEGDKVFPPTYAGGVYAVEDRRIDGRVVRCVLLDSVQSQANRMEEALLEAFLPNWRELKPDGADPPCAMPVVAVYVENHGWITSLTAPHRVHDAILRDSEIEEEKNGEKKKVRFRDSEIGKAIVRARPHDATAFYRYCPTALLLGTWDSTAGEGLGSAKVARAVVSEIIGVDVTAGVRTHSRIDPLGIKANAAVIYRRAEDQNDWTLNEREAAKDSRGSALRFGTGPRQGRPSAINHGNVTPDLDRFGDAREVRNQHLGQLPDVLRDEPVELRYEFRSRDGELRSYSAVRGRSIEGHALKPGGATMTYALHTWALSLTQLRRLRFPVDGNHDGNRNLAARTVLAAMAVYALALQRHCGCGYSLRSRCELVPQVGTNSAAFESVNVDGTTTPFKLLDTHAARQVLDTALTQAQETIIWEGRVIRLTPMEKLAELVRASDARQPDQDAVANEPEASEGEGNDARDQD